MRRVGLVVFVALLAACAPHKKRVRSPQPVGEPSSASRRPADRGPLGVPRVLPVMPAEGVVDLGPVLVPIERGALPPIEMLKDAEQRLYADAFVFEGQRSYEVYRVTTVVVRNTGPRLADQLSTTTVFVYRGPLVGGRDPARTGFYRALRYHDGPMEPCKWSREKLGERFAPVFEGVTDVREQLRRLHVLLVHGVMPPKVYRPLRLSCAQQLERRAAPPSPEAAP